MNRLLNRVEALEQRVGATEELVNLSWFREGFPLPRSQWDALLAEVLSHGSSLGPGYRPPEEPAAGTENEWP